MDPSIESRRWHKSEPEVRSAGNGLGSSCWRQFLMLYVGLIFCCILLGVNSPSVISLHERLFPEPMDFRWWYSLQLLSGGFALLSSVYALWLSRRMSFGQSWLDRLVMLAAFLFVPMVVYKSAVVVLGNMGPL